MAGPSVSVIIPAYNDEGSLRGVLEETAAHLERRALSYEIIVMDDGSRDGTGRLLEDLAAQNPRVKSHHHSVNHGFGRTIRELYGLATMDLVFSLPGDGQLPVENLDTMLVLLDRYDVVIGWRRLRHDPWRRRLQSGMYNLCLRLLFGWHLRDVNSTKLMRREVLQRVRLDAASPFVDAELCLRAARLGYRVGEVVVKHRERRHGEASGGKWLTVEETFRDLIRFRLHPRW